MSCRAEPRITPGAAIALGLLHGPAELLPVSSSAHITLLPWLVGARYARAEPELRKTFEVALHAGALAALLPELGRELSGLTGGLDRRRLGVLAAAFLPPALCGYVLEAPIERRLGTPDTIAAGLLAGAVAMVLADRRPARRDPAEAGVIDGLWLGVAQTCALIPGVSRAGATLAAARYRSFTRPASAVLSREAGLPVIAAASGLKALRTLRHRDAPPTGSRLALALGAGASLISTLASRGLATRLAQGGPLAPFAAYRLGLAMLVVGRGGQLRASSRRDGK